MVYDLSGNEIGLARVATRDLPGGGKVGAMCFYDEDVALSSTTVMVDIPQPPPTEPTMGPKPVVRRLSDEEQLTSMLPRSSGS